jgi:hypothetical protein
VVRGHQGRHHLRSPCLARCIEKRGGPNRPSAPATPGCVSNDGFKATRPVAARAGELAVDGGGIVAMAVRRSTHHPQTCACAPSFLAQSILQGTVAAVDSAVPAPAPRPGGPHAAVGVQSPWDSSSQPYGGLASPNWKQVVRYSRRAGADTRIISTVNPDGFE